LAKKLKLKKNKFFLIFTYFVIPAQAGIQKICFVINHNFWIPFNLPLADLNFIGMTKEKRIKKNSPVFKQGFSVSIDKNLSSIFQFGKMTIVILSSPPFCHPDESQDLMDILQTLGSSLS